MLLRITNGFEKLSDASLIAKANNITEGIGAHPTEFPTPSPTIVVVQTAIDAFQATLAVAQAGSMYDKAVKNQKRQDVIDLLHSVGYYVLFTANGDPLVVKAANLEVAKPGTPSGDIDAPQTPKLSDGANSGDLNLEINKVKGAKGYVYQVSADLAVPGAWTSTTGTARKTTLSGLTPGLRYHVRVIAIGTNGQGVYSPIASRIVQ